MTPFNHDLFRRHQGRAKPGKSVPTCSAPSCTATPVWQGPHHIWGRQDRGWLGGYCDDHAHLIRD